MISSNNSEQNFYACAHLTAITIINCPAQIQTQSSFISRTVRSNSIRLNGAIFGNR